MRPGTVLRDRHGTIALILGPTSAPDPNRARSHNVTPVLFFDAEGPPFRYDAPTDLLFDRARVIWPSTSPR